MSYGSRITWTGNVFLQHIAGPNVEKFACDKRDVFFHDGVTPLLRKFRRLLSVSDRNSVFQTLKFFSWTWRAVSGEGKTAHNDSPMKFLFIEPKFARPMTESWESESQRVDASLRCPCNNIHIHIYLHGINGSMGLGGRLRQYI